MTAALRVMAPGLMTTLQDLGRPGYQRLGVPVSGALDHVSLRAANLLVGNGSTVGALEIASPGPTARAAVRLPPTDITPRSRVRIVLGPQDAYFTPEGLRALLGSTYTVSQASDRMGMRLEGPPLEHSAKGYNIVTDGTAHGSIQVPGNGLPIILLADRQTTGGYPKIAAVISAAIPALGRLTPGAKITFEAVDIEAAEAAARQLAADIAAMAARITPVRREAAIDATRLMGENLVSGVVNAREGGGS